MESGPDGTRPAFQVGKALPPVRRRRQSGRIKTDAVVFDFEGQVGRTEADPNTNLGSSTVTNGVVNRLLDPKTGKLVAIKAGEPIVGADPDVANPPVDPVQTGAVVSSPTKPATRSQPNEDWKYPMTSTI